MGKVNVVDEIVKVDVVDVVDSAPVDEVDK